MDNSNIMVVEVNGIKLEVDLRHAKRVDTLVVGSKVKLLKKKTQYESSKVYPGVVVGFEPFKDLPTIVVAYLDADWNTSSVKFIAINSDTTEFDMIASVDDDLMINKSDTLRSFQREIDTKTKEIEQIRAKMEYFLSHFGKHFEKSKEEA